MADRRFFAKQDAISASEIADYVSGTLHRDVATTKIDGCDEPERAGHNDIVFIASPKYLSRIEHSQAGAVLCTKACADDMPDHMAVILVGNPQQAFAKIARMLFPNAVKPTSFTGSQNIHASAHVDPTAKIEEGVTIEAGAVVGAEAEIGRDTVIGPNAVIGEKVAIGRNCSIGPNSSVLHALLGDHVIIHAGARIGCDGFGFIPGAQGLEKVPQIGRVILQDDVEIGANACIDRGALGDTVIAENAKIDNMVQIAHNVQIGRSNAIAALSGIAGSAETGMGVMIGGQTGVADHVSIGDSVMIAANSAVKDDLASGGRYLGVPARPFRQAARQMAALSVLADQYIKGKKNG